MMMTLMWVISKYSHCWFFVIFSVKSSVCGSRIHSIHAKLLARCGTSMFIQIWFMLSTTRSCDMNHILVQFAMCVCMRVFQWRLLVFSIHLYQCVRNVVTQQCLVLVIFTSEVGNLNDSNMYWFTFIPVVAFSKLQGCQCYLPDHGQTGSH